MHVEYAQTMQRYVPLISRGLISNGWESELVEPLAAAIDSMKREAERFATARDTRLMSGPSRAVRERVNAELRRVERELIRPSGLIGRPWWRSLIYAADVNNGYATMSFPGVNEAVRERDESRVRTELDDLTAAFHAATAALASAREALNGR